MLHNKYIRIFKVETVTCLKGSIKCFTPVVIKDIHLNRYTVEFQYKRNGGDRPIFRLYWNFAFIGILCSQTSLIRMSRYPVEILRNQLKNILVALANPDFWFRIRMIR